MTNILTRDARSGLLAGRERPVRPGLVLAVVLIGQFMAVLDASIVNVAAPSIHAVLHASGASLQLVVAGYTITYAVLLVTGARLGDILGHRRVFLGGLLISANLFGSSWRPVFLVNVPVGVALLAVGARALPHGKGEPGRTLDLSGLVLLTPAVLAFVLPLVLGQPEHWPLWGWVLMAASLPMVAAFAAAERRVARAGGTPLIPGRVLRVPGVAVAIAALFTVMTIFSGFFFTLALHLQDGLGYSPLRAGLAFAPAAATFALVSLNWRRLPARWHGTLIVSGFVLFAAAMAGLAWVLRSGGTGGAGLYLIGALGGAGMAAAFSPLMTRVLLNAAAIPAPDATGVVVTVNQLGLLVGVAAFGTLYLNLAGRLPGPAAFLAFRHVSAHAEAVTFLALAALAAVGVILAAVHVIERRTANG